MILILRSRTLSRYNVFHYTCYSSEMLPPLSVYNLIYLKSCNIRTSNPPSSCVSCTGIIQILYDMSSFTYKIHLIWMTYQHNLSSISNLNFLCQLIAMCARICLILLCKLRLNNMLFFTICDSIIIQYVTLTFSTFSPKVSQRTFHEITLISLFLVYYNWISLC